MFLSGFFVFLHSYVLFIVFFSAELVRLPFVSSTQFVSAFQYHTCLLLLFLLVFVEQFPHLLRVISGVSLMRGSARLINDFIGLSVGVASAASAIKPEVEGLALAPINHLPPNPFTGALADKTCRTFPFQSGHHLCNSAIILWVSAILFWRMFIHALYSNLNPWFYRHTNSLCFSLG
eukprot:GHVT01001101.1.p1 GENE.GHVT01001101.1~~GHVT01001101.1.p1  ORF type:complete len:177 (+),score=4.03 GHVT01001101.1:236-766(+)